MAMWLLLGLGLLVFIVGATCLMSPPTTGARTAVIGLAVWAVGLLLLIAWQAILYLVVLVILVGIAAIWEPSAAARSPREYGGSGGWFGDSEGHRRAALKGWRSRR
jgi:hypothetical protein